MRRSSEEFEMRRILTPWLRGLVPGARIVHELVVGGDRRIDMAAIGTDTVVGVEIKSSRDTLDRLDGQMRRFKAVLPLTILAVAPKWHRHEATRGHGHVITVDPTGVDRRLHGTEYLSVRNIDRTVTVPVLWLLWAPELRNITARLRLSGNPRATMSQSAVSQHLALMRSAGIVATRRDRTNIYYRIKDERARLLLEAVRSVAGPEDAT